MNYTTIEQSKKLLELGLDPKTSDCNWQHAPGYENHKGEITGFWDEPEWGQSGDSKDLPCWSLRALLEVIPEEIKIDNLNCLAIMYLIHSNYSVRYMHDKTGDTIKETHGTTPIEAAYSMVIWLLENGFIKKEPKTSSE